MRRGPVVVGLVVGVLVAVGVASGDSTRLRGGPHGSDDPSFLVKLARRARAGAAAPNPRAARPPRCPATDRHLGTSQIKTFERRLVALHPVGVLLCRYAGLHPTPRRAGLLARSARVSRPTTLRALVRQLNRLKPLSAGPRACPNVTGEKIVLFFHYRRHEPITVTVDTDGCKVISNGEMDRSGDVGAGPALVKRLKTLTG